MRAILGPQKNSVPCCSIYSIALSLTGLSSFGNRLRMAPTTPAKRPDAIALIGPEYDQPSSQPADRTLIICSAPRTGSYELCRYLLAAGIGVPHEYFNPNYARRLGERWAFPKSPLETSELKRYIEILRRRRAQAGVFATKLQFPHFNRTLRGNRHGRQLFEGATVVHLFRPDAVAQYEPSASCSGQKKS
jgi:Stf0 sulfotransferase